MGKRRAPRVPVSVPVLVFGVDQDGLPFGQAAKTTEIGRFGAQIEGLRYKPKPDGILIVQCGDKKARFRIVWVGDPETPRAGRVGVRCLEWGKFGWNIEVPGPAPDFFEQTPAAEIILPAPDILRPEGRRQHLRVPCNLALQLKREGVETPLWCNINDISSGGCYVVMRSPFPVGTVVELLFRDDRVQIECRGLVRTSDTALGMGIEFTDIDEREEAKLQVLMRRHRTLSKTIASGAAQGLVVDKPDPDYRMPSAANFDADLILELLLFKFRHVEHISREEFLELLQKTKLAPEVHELTSYEPAERTRVV